MDLPLIGSKPPIRWIAVEVQGEKGLAPRKKLSLQYYWNGAWIDVPMAEEGSDG